MNYMDEYLNNKINIYASIEHDYLEYRVYLGHEMMGKFNTLNEAWAFADVYIERLLRFRKTQESKEKDVFRNKDGIVTQQDALKGGER